MAIALNTVLPPTDANSGHVTVILHSHWTPDRTTQTGEAAKIVMQQQQN